MSEHPVSCEEFDAHADELALGAVGEPMRSRLLDHTNTCAECRALLDGLGTVADRLLVLAPEADPPAGFESRVLARVETTARPRSGRWFAVAAVALLAIAGAAVALAVSARGTEDPVAAIVTRDGAEIGSAHLVADPKPHVLVVIDAPRPDPGTRTCELQRPDGTWVEVGSWEVADVASGVWAVGIAEDLLDARAMRITAGDGTVLATATW